MNSYSNEGANDKEKVQTNIIIPEFGLHFQKLNKMSQYEKWKAWLNSLFPNKDGED